jgi:cysteinyl-tRNA synthetase
MYICGPTVYDHPHVGHGRFLLVFDVLRRYLEWTGNEVVYVSNVTDIDDKIIKRANEEGRSPEDVAVEFEKAWYDAVDRLGVKRPTHDPHATAYVEQMVSWVAGLVEAGAAYETSDGVYLSVAAVPDYGLLKPGQALDDMRSGARVEVNEEKGAARDFALWKKVKPGEPSWPSPWGGGRPGWHTECVVMALDLLGDGFDLHGGGQDLIFPHHENERAQAVAAGRDFARRWAHNGFVVVGGTGGAVKMSKSLGNFTTLTDLLAANDPRTYRLLVLQSHYRAPLEVTKASLDHASATLRGLDDFVRRTADLPAVAPDPAALDAFRAAMDDDLSTPAVVALLSDLRRRANVHLDAGEREPAAPLAAALREISDAVGLSLGPAGEEEVPPGVVDLVARRDQARAARDFAGADALRDQLVGMGWVVEDTPAGTKVHQ